MLGMYGYGAEHSTCNYRMAPGFKGSTCDTVSEPLKSADLKGTEPAYVALKPVQIRVSSVIRRQRLSTQNAPETVCQLGSATRARWGAHSAPETPIWIGSAARDVCRRREKQKWGGGRQDGKRDIWESREGNRKKGILKGIGWERRVH